ncbi:T9SS type A sorting domain-containing protein [candidate division KSB1 bacterium]|nr:T9SS type A sorting domain-containing protein [candidate division KSB1 bacterium]
MKSISNFLFTLFFIFILFPDSTFAELLCHYPFNGNADDASSNGFNGTVNGTVIAEDRFGKSNNAYYFDGEDDYISIGDYSELKPNFPFTIIAWINIESGAYYPPIFCNNYVENYYYGVLLNIVSDNRLALNIGNGGEVSDVTRNTKRGSTYLEYDTWYHVAAVVNGINDIELYVNGENDGGSYSGAATEMVYSSGSASIGRSDGSRDSGGEHYFKGKIDEVLFYDNAFTSAQIMDHYKETSRLGLVCYFPFDGNSNDASGNDYHASGNGATATTDRFGTENSAYYFNGAGEFLSLGSQIGLKPQFPFSITAWIKMENDAYYPPIFLNDYIENHYYGMLFNITSDEKKLTIGFGNGGEVGENSRNTKTGETSLSACTWYHVAAVARGVNDMDLYVNGQNDGGSYAGNATSLVYGSGNSRIGMSDGSMHSGGEHYFKGSIDELYFYDYALSGDQINAYYQSTALPVELVSFNAEQVDSYINLTWATASETNNMGFEIQKSTDNSTFRTIGFVEGALTSVNMHSYSFMDTELPSATCYYRLKQIDTDGTFKYSLTVEVSVREVPQLFALYQNYPNPFNPLTTIRYDIPVATDVMVTIFDITGREVIWLIDRFETAGNHRVSWDACDRYGNPVSGGLYFYQLKAGDFMQLRKMILLH